MKDDAAMSRRTLLGTGVALSAVLAGCTGSGGAGEEENTETTEVTDEETETETETTAQTTADPTPTLEEFEYPAGANRDGIDGATLFGTHESTLTSAGSTTLESDIAREFNDFSESIAVTSELAGGGVARVTEGEELTESLWSPSGESAAFVRMESGFEQRFRIDNRAPSPNEVAEFDRFRRLLAGAEWSEATEVVEAEDDYAAVYQSTGIADEQSLLRLVFGESVTEFEARVSVTQSGHVRDLSYDISVDRDGDTARRDVSITVGAVGETTVEEPDWAATAREEGVRFTLQPTDGRRAVVLEMVNGADVPPETRASLSAGRNWGEAQLSEALSEGDRLYIALSEDGTLLTDESGVPDGATELSGQPSVTLRLHSYVLFRGSA